MYFNFNWILGFVCDIIHVKFKEEPVPLINKEILPPLTPSLHIVLMVLHLWKREREKSIKKAVLEISKESTLY